MKKDSTTLAFLGDAFFELSVRRRIVERSGSLAADKLHLAAVRYVRASAQARAMRALISQEILSEEEIDVARRARNRKPKSVPKNADILDYKFATALEALIGYYYIKNKTDRAETLTEFAMNVIDGDKG